MAKFEIHNTISGVCFGIYEGDTAADALDAMAQDAGYKDAAEQAEVSRSKPGEIVAVEVTA